MPQGLQRHQVDRLWRFGLRLLVAVLGFGGRGREQLLGHCRLLVRDDVVRPAPRGDGGAQFLAGRRAGEDGPLVLQRDAGVSPTPRLQLRGWGAAGAPGSAGAADRGAVPLGDHGAGGAVVGDGLLVDVPVGVVNQISGSGPYASS
ncbi:hypothetical protein [Streptomyces sp. NPDC020742]|uniref:hypothetical protein n=1 Tax=Streptomyces sp. NPDC020742 TaxID=3154897 RepID=UPI00341108CD